MITTIILFILFLISCVWVYAKLSSGISKCSRHLVGKVIIVTGGNAGIGYETAKDLADRGARVILACRSEERGTKARNKIVAETGNNDVHFKQLDLASFASVKKFAENIIQTEEKIDILINNAGMYGSDLSRTEDGLLDLMQVNHFGPFLLTSLLLPLIKKAAPSRIINVSSEAHRRGKIDINDLNFDKETKETKSDFHIYSTSKLCNVLFNLELHHRLHGSGVTCNALHPGVVETDILYDNKAPIVRLTLPFVKLFYKDPWEGAQTTIYLAVSREVDKVSGKYYRDCHIANVSKAGRDSNLARKLWEKSEEIVGLKNIEI